MRYVIYVIRVNLISIITYSLNALLNRWYSHTGLEPSLVLPGPRIRQLGPVLAIEAVTIEDAGVYRCTSSNAGGEAGAELRLVVSTPLHVEISPPILSVHMGGSAEFKCVVTAQGGGPHLVTWYKDGRQLPNTGRTASEIMIVNNVGRDDRGMYQCVVRRAEGDTAQAAAELQLGGESMLQVLLDAREIVFVSTSFR